MATVYTIAQAKGGTGKSTTASELAFLLAQAGRRVLAIDCDQQGNMTTRLGISRNAEVEATAADLIRGDVDAETAAISSTTVDGVDVAAGATDLEQIERSPELVASLRDYLPSLHGWDAIVIDTPPALGVVTMAALAAADVIIVPVPPQSEAWEQIRRLDLFVSRRVNRLNPDAKIGLVIPTMHDHRRLLDRELVEQLTATYGDRVTPPIRETVAVRDAYTSGMPVGRYAPRSTAALDYAEALKPLIKER